jgi:predicted ATP-dependent serine protease
MAARLKEAARLGFTTALVPRGVVDAPAGLSVVVVNDLAETFAHVDCTGQSERGGELVA